MSRVLLEDGYLGMGQEVASYEAELAQFIGVPLDNVACVNSGTAALHLSVQASVAAGEEVLVQSLTFVASLQAIRAAGAVPVFCDVQADTCTLDLHDAERKRSPRTKAIMPVYYAGNPADDSAIFDFAGQHNLRVIEDAAHAFGCNGDRGMVGARGDMTCFSFDGIKNITCGEGGAVVSGDPEVLSKVRDARLLGVVRDSEAREAGRRSWDFDVMAQGYRYHMSNILAAIGRVQLSRFLTEFAPRRVALARLYQERLREVPGVTLLSFTPGPVIPHIFPVRVGGGRRDSVRAALAAAGIETGIQYKPAHLLTYFGSGRDHLPVTMQLYREILSLPLHPGLEPSDVQNVCDTLRKAVS